MINVVAFPTNNLKINILNQFMKKNAKCIDCIACNSNRGNLNRYIQSVHERKRPFK